ncbi:HNH endonuclease [Candidatus Peregrinibacteria bacterium]|jgi:hypothetical protein|nr:HNH endonuclease [Candidatus Peregrinibacteria bacterium]
MKKHIKIYLKHFGYGEQDFIPSELSGMQAVDIHHIQYGRGKRKDVIENLMALTREEHDRAHFKRKPYLTREELQEIHDRFLNQ